MFRFITKSNWKQRIVTLLVLVLAVLLIIKYADVSALGGLPSPAAIRAQEQELRRRQKQLVELQRERQMNRLDLEQLQQQAQSFWKVSAQSPLMEVPTEFKKLARKAQTNPQQIGAPSMNKVLNLNHVREVEFSIRLTAPMREVTRLLTQIEQAQENFYWSRCNINPDNPRTPKQVVVNGRMKALVLSSEASRFLSGERAHLGEELDTDG